MQEDYKGLSQTIQSGDWKGEKHVPIIHAPAKARKTQKIEIRVSVGDSVKHPNTFEHHIAWIKLFFQPEKTPFPIEIADFRFPAHGENGLFSVPVGVTELWLQESGTVYALSFCNIHGLWENKKKIVVE